MIELKGIKVVRRGRKILDIPHLLFEPNRSYALTGENGSGKTTLLRLLAGVIQPTEGTVKGLDGMQIAYLPQKPYLFRMNVWKNLSFALSEPKKHADELQHAINAVGMQGFEQQEAEKLSGGEAQRVAIARLLLIKANLVLLDEPTAPIDLRGREQIDLVISEYVKANRATLIFATHSLEQAAKLADTVIHLQDSTLNA
ncbi:MAG: ABC transporter ATP-binding protein [Anaerolineaceae bacterium]|nr:ABC transporter ATP-binding protein [Anaerolineaceae bacterium]